MEVGCKEPRPSRGGTRRWAAGGAQRRPKGRTRRSRRNCGGTEHARRPLSVSTGRCGVSLLEGVGRDLGLDRRGRPSPAQTRPPYDPSRKAASQSISPSAAKARRCNRSPEASPLRVNQTNSLEISTGQQLASLASTAQRLVMPGRAVDARLNAIGRSSPQELAEFQDGVCAVPRLIFVGHGLRPS
jgi:hypothetical protein